MEHDDPEVRMRVKGLMLDPSSNVPIVILHDEDNRLLLPIWIGVFEANAIALKMEGVQVPRPMTHDLLRSAIQALGARIERVEVHKLHENTFYAKIHLSTASGDEVILDSRPSDALALALRTDASIFVRRSVLDQAKAIDLTEKVSDEERLKKWLEEASPEDLGKYTM